MIQSIYENILNDNTNNYDRENRIQVNNIDIELTINGTFLRIKDATPSALLTLLVNLYQFNSKPDNVKYADFLAEYIGRQRENASGDFKKFIAQFKDPQNIHLDQFDESPNFQLSLNYDLMGPSILTGETNRIRNVLDKDILADKRGYLQRERFELFPEFLEDYSDTDLGEAIHIFEGHPPTRDEINRIQRRYRLSNQYTRPVITESQKRTLSNMRGTGIPKSHNNFLANHHTITSHLNRYHIDLPATITNFLKTISQKEQKLNIF